MDGDTTDLSDSSDDKSDCEPPVKKAENPSEEKDKDEDTFQKTKKADTEDKIACDVCGKIYSRKQSLLRHIRIIHSSNKIKCEFCGKEFSRKDNLMRHQRMRCQKGSPSNEEVLNPMSHRAGTTGATESTGSVPKQSQILSAIDGPSRKHDSFKNSNERHDDHDDNDSNGSIKKSDEISDQHDDLSDSEKSDGEPQMKKAKNPSEEKDKQEDTIQKRSNADAEGKIACNVCGKIYSQKWNLLRHIRIIHSLKKIKCEFCGKEFTRKDSLICHQRTCHKGSHSNEEKSPMEYLINMMTRICLLVITQKMKW